MPQFSIHDVVIIGGGAHGASAFYQCVRQGLDTICIDKFHPPHNTGSSHGDTRITRQASGEGIQYTELGLRSNQIWRELEKQTKRSLMVPNGLLIIAHPDSKFLKTTIEASLVYGIGHMILSSQYIRQRWPQFIVDDDEMGYFELGGGFLRPEECIATQLELGKKLGGQLLVNTIAESLQEIDNNVVSVTTNRDKFLARKVIVTAGAWVKDFLPEAYRNIFTVSRQAQFWFQTENYSSLQQEKFPTFISIKQDGRFLYGFPAIDGPNGGLKVASHNTTDVTDPNNINRAVNAEEIAQMHRDYVAPRLKGLTPECNRTTTCMYTSTPDKDFVIDWHPELKNVIIASPCSGHGFKHSAAIGEILALMATSDKIRVHGPEEFSFKRFLENSSGLTH